MKNILLLAAIALLASCSSQKHITTQETRVDSSVYHVRDSFNLVIKSLTTSYEKKLIEARKTSVRFETIPCPEQVINIDSACNKDSLIAKIKQQAKYINSLQNTVKVNADGSTEYTGRIAEVQTSLDKTESELSKVTAINLQLQHTNDSLSTELLLTQSAKQVDKKSGFLNNIGFTIALFLIALVLGMIIGYKFKK